jgi:hypothetical protein
MLLQHRRAVERLKKKKLGKQGWFHCIRIRTALFVLGAIIVSMTATIVKVYAGESILASALYHYDTTATVVGLRRYSGTGPHPPETEPVEDDHQATDDHATDDHHAFSLFGAISYLKLTQGTLSILIIVLAVLTVEYCFHMLHVVTHDTPFNQMVQSIEKELMAVGFTAFAFKIMVDTTHFLDLDWFHALEYAGQ